MYIALLYFYIFAIAFVELSGTTIAVRVFFTLFGLFLSLIHCNSKIFILLLINVPIVIYSFITSLLYETGDNSFTSTILKGYAYFLAAYFVVYIIYRNSKLTSEELINCLLKSYFYATLFQLTLGLLSFLFPPLLSFFNSFIYAVNSERIEDLSTLRLVFPGETNFFGMGIVCCTAMLIWAYFIETKQWKLNTLSLLKFLYLLALGTMGARTTLIGALLCSLYLLPALKNIMKIYYVFTIPLLIGIGSIMIFSFLPEELLRFAFEHFYSFAENDQFESQSTNHLMEMWSVLPNNQQTLFLGDGKWVSEDGYYMNTDVGYLRFIFYFGIVGTVLLFISQIVQYMYIKSFFNDSNIKKLLFFTLILFFVLNIKGAVILITASGGLLGVICVAAILPVQSK